MGGGCAPERWGFRIRGPPRFFASYLLSPAACWPGDLLEAHPDIEDRESAVSTACRPHAARPNQHKTLKRSITKFQILPLRASNPPRK